MLADIWVLGVATVIVVIGIVVTFKMRPACPDCKKKMHETFPHNNKEVYRCESCNREWIQL